jgi:hypothetical protein
VRFRETFLTVIVVVARVRDEVLYTLLAAPSTPLRSCQTLVLANVRQDPRPLRCPLTGTLLLAAVWPLVRIREVPAEDPRLRHWVHSTAAWTLSGAHHRLPLHCHLAGTRMDPIVAPLRVPVLLDPRCVGSSAAWPLANTHRRLCLRASSHASSMLFFKESVALIHSERRKGQYLGWRGVVVNADAG